MAGREQRLLRTGAAAVRAGADRRLRGAERGGGKRRPPGSAAGGPGGGAGPAAPRARTLRPRAAVAAGGAGAVDGVLADQRTAGGLPRGPGQPVGESLLLRPLLASCAAWTSATGPPGAHRDRAHGGPLGSPLGGPPRDARPRLGAPAGSRAQRALLRRPGSPPPNCTPGCSNRGSRWSRCRTPRSTTPAGPRRGCCAGGRRRTCAKSGARARWRLFALADPQPLLSRPGASSVSTDRAEPGAATPGGLPAAPSLHALLEAARGSGCVERAPGDWTRVLARAPGRFELGIGFSLGRVLAKGPRCT